MQYFCPKRFNRFPRFTIFFKKGQKEDENTFAEENTVSLNADFLKYLSDKRNVSSQVNHDTQSSINPNYSQIDGTRASVGPEGGQPKKTATFNVDELDKLEQQF